MHNAYLDAFRLAVCFFRNIQNKLRVLSSLPNRLNSVYCVKTAFKNRHE